MTNIEEARPLPAASSRSVRIDWDVPNSSPRLDSAGILKEARARVAKLMFEGEVIEHESTPSWDDKFPVEIEGRLVDPAAENKVIYSVGFQIGPKDESPKP